MSSEQKIKMVDLRLLDDVFDMHDGYVLDFTNATFGIFFREEVGVNIDAERFHAEGSSKAKRLRYFLRSSSPQLASKTIRALLDYRDYQFRRKSVQDPFPEGRTDVLKLIARLDGKNESAQFDQPSESKPQKLLDVSTSTSLARDLMSITQLDPHPRGFAFEKFLKDLFEAFNLAPRSSFRLRGEQIDGSFEANGETYLLEAKWTNQPVGAAVLRAFDATVADKAAWARGLFVSQTGFSEDGLSAFGRGKRIICMDGLDLYEILQRDLSFGEVLALKVRRAAETGNPFVRIRDLSI